MPWYVLYTKPKNEKKVTKLLSEKGIEVYCPLKEEIRQWSDRKKKIAEPVFKSYVFVSLNDYKEENVTVLNTPGSVRFLWWNKKPGIVRDKEIQDIKDFLNNYRDAEINMEFNAGEAVIVGEGPLREQHGTILQVRGNKAYLLIKTLSLSLVATLPVQSLKHKD
jgi:transcription antitermination factor NusG